MSKITLSWNGRTPEGIIAYDKDFKDILEFIMRGKGDKWIISFYAYDNKVSLKFQEKMIAMLQKKIIDENFLWEKEEIQFFAQESQYSPDDLLQKLEKIQAQQSGIVTLYESIDYRYKISAHGEKKYAVHQAIARILEEKKIFLFLFGNIPYDIHHVRENSPLIKFLWREYRIKEYGKNELRVLDQLKENIGESILKYSAGNFELVHGLENFWGDIELEKRVTELVNNFIEVPLTTEIEKMVYEKLVLLKDFLENNQDIIGDNIEYFDNDMISILQKKDSRLFKAYFDKTALFDSKEIPKQLQEYYELKPKAEFAQVIKKSGFIRNKGKIEPLPQIHGTSSHDFSEIASYFDTTKPIFILGAGTSLVSRAPDRRMLFKEILKQIFPSDEERLEELSFKELKKRFQKLVNERLRKDIRYRVIQLLGDLKPSVGHFHLTQLVKAEQVSAMITTNFDTLLEDSLMDYGIRSKDFIKLVSRENLNDREWDWVSTFPKHLKLFKICGDIYYGSGLAVDDEAANKWIESALKVMTKLKDFSESDFFIILGHKFEEIDLSRIFEAKSVENLIVVYANPDENDCNQFEEKYQHKGIIKSIHGDFGRFDNFMQELCRRLRQKNFI